MNRLISSLSIVLLLALCFLTQAAQAYTCADVPSNVNGNVTITESGACTIDHPVTATGKIAISAGSTINAQGLSADAEVDLSAPGDITIDGGILAANYFVHVQGGSINVSGPVTTVNQGNILLVAQQNLATGTISAAPGFNIDLKANVAGGNVPFTIGSSGQSNGVNGAIVAHTYGYQPAFASAIIYVTNGDSNSTGGITVADPASLSLAANGRERAGYLYLNAQKGTLSLPSGTIALDGTATAGAGVIGLMADTVAFGADAILSASEAIPQSTMHGIAISANTITYQGVDGLKLLADGPGYSHDYRGFVRIFPSGGINMVDNQDPSTLVINGNYVLSPPGGVAITGDAGSPLLVSANGSHNLVSLVGQPLSFAGGAVTLSAQGVEDHNIEVLNAVGSSLTFANMGDVILDASGQADNSNWPSGGTIDFYAGDTSISSPQIRFLADGPSGASGNGGIVNIVTTAFNLDAASKASVSANGGAGGGDASQNAITFNPGNSNFKIGSDVGQISFAARGGVDNGNGGVIKLLGNSSAVTVYGAGETSTTIDVSAPGSQGNGGEIHLTANNGLTFDGTSSFLKADAGTSEGVGGKIIIHTAVNPVVIGVGQEGNVSLSANAHGMNAANGGTIEVLSPAGITVDTAHLSVLPGDSGDGGNISLDAGTSMLTLNGDLIADGGISTGKGGVLTLAADGLTLPATASTLLRANGTSDGKGGTLSVTTHGQGVTISEDIQALKLEAKGGDSGGDGGIISITSDSDINLAGASVNISSGSGNGGELAISTDKNINTTGVINVNGGCPSGDGGTIILEGEIVSTLGSINVNGGYGSGESGSSCLAIAAVDMPTVTTVIAALDLSSSFMGGHVNALTSNTPNSGKGGKVIVKGNEWATGVLTELHADAVGDGDGGSIEINNDLVVADLKNAPANFLTAKGGPTGSGGTVRVKKAKDSVLGAINVNKIIKVESPPRKAQGIFNGEISLNGVTCRQWQTSLNNWPKVFWDCGSPSAPSKPSTKAKNLVVAANRLEPVLKVQLGQTMTPENPAVNIYAMTSIEDLEGFLGFKLQAGWDLGLYGYSFVNYRIAVAFANIYDPAHELKSASAFSKNPKVMQMSLLHELGHQLDYIWGYESALDNGFKTLRDPDSAILNLYACNEVFEQWRCELKPPSWSTADLLFNSVDYAINIHSQNHDAELFGRMFAHRYSKEFGWSFAKDQETAYDKFELMKAYIDMLVASPPPPMN